MTRNIRTAAGALALGFLLLPLVGCAPEPGSVRPDGTDLTEKHEPEGGSWSEPNPEEAYEKGQELPADFPVAFVVPEGAVIDDIGSRGYGTWYVVFRTDEATQAAALWDEVIRAGSFTVSEEVETGDGGRAATLTSPELSVSAVTMADEAQATLLSYDITAVVM